MVDFIEFDVAAKRFLADVSEAEVLIGLLESLAHLADSIFSSIQGSGASGGQIAESQNKVKTCLAETKTIVSSANPRHLFRSLDEVKNSIRDMGKAGDAEGSGFFNIENDLENFAESYAQYLSGGSVARSLSMLWSATVLNLKIKSYFETFNFFLSADEDRLVPGENERELLLWLPGYMDLKQFSQKLQAIQLLYTELCMIFSISESDYPLRLVRAKSGSLWVKVFGETRVIQMISEFIEKMAGWLYRNYTVEGKINSIPRKVEVIDSLLDLTAKLEAAGLDVSEMRPNIEKSAVVVSRELVTLLENQSSVVINRININVDPGAEQGERKLLQGPSHANKH